MSKNYLCWKKVGLLNTPLMNIMKRESSVHMQDNIQCTNIYWEICTVSSFGLFWYTFVLYKSQQV